MFTASINGRHTEITFSHQRSSESAPLTRPTLRSSRREPVFAVTYCNFDGGAKGVAWCSMEDAGRYSKEKGRKVSLAAAIQSVLPRKGKKGRDARLLVWNAYFAAKAVKRMESTFYTNFRPAISNEPPLQEPEIHWRLSQPVPDDVIAYLNQEDQDNI